MEDGVAELLVGVDLVVVGDEEGAVADEGDAGGVVAAVDLIADDAQAEGVGALAEVGVDVLQQAHAGDLVGEVVLRVVHGLAAVELGVVGDVGVGLAGVDVQGDAVVVEKLDDVLQRLRGRREGLAVVLFHPVELEEQVGAVGVDAPVGEGGLGAVVKYDALGLPVVGEAVVVGVDGVLGRFEGNECGGVVGGGRLEAGEGEGLGLCAHLVAPFCVVVDMGCFDAHDFMQGVCAGKPG